MKIYEILSFNRELLHRLFVVGIKADHYKYIDLYDEYRRLHEGGGKVTYIVAILADKYGVSERQVYHIISYLGKDCNDIAV